MPKAARTSNSINACFLREDRDGTVTSGVWFFIFIVELHRKLAVFEPELECDSWQLASVLGKNGSEFIFQSHRWLPKLFVKS